MHSVSAMPPQAMAQTLRNARGARSPRQYCEIFNKRTEGKQDMRREEGQDSSPWGQRECLGHLTYDSVCVPVYPGRKGRAVGGGCARLQLLPGTWALLPRRVICNPPMPAVQQSTSACFHSAAEHVHARWKGGGGLTQVSSSRRAHSRQDGFCGHGMSRGQPAGLCAHEPLCRLRMWYRSHLQCRSRDWPLAIATGQCTTSTQYRICG